MYYKLGKLVLQIGEALLYYKLGQTLLRIGADLLLQIKEGFITNWGRYYKLGKPLLQNRAAITNWGKMGIYHFINSFGNISILWTCILLHFLFTDYFLCTSNTILWRGFI